MGLDWIGEGLVKERMGQGIANIRGKYRSHRVLCPLNIVPRTCSGSVGWHLEAHGIVFKAGAREVHGYGFQLSRQVVWHARVARLLDPVQLPVHLVRVLWPCGFIEGCVGRPPRTLDIRPTKAQVGLGKWI